MEEPKVQGPDCPHCIKREQEIRQAEEHGFAILVALMPLLTVTLLSGLGIF